MTAIQHYTGTLVIVECANCHQPFGITQATENARRADHQGFSCPSGHTNYYPQQSQLELERARRIRAEAGRAQYQDALGMERRSKAALKGHLTRARNKIAAGQCPVADCGQHFGNVREHMRHKHPEFHLTDPETGKVVAL